MKLSLVLRCWEEEEGSNITNQHIDIVLTQTGVGIELNGERRGSSRIIMATKREMYF